MRRGASASPTGLSQAEPEVSALRASIPSAGFTLTNGSAPRTADKLRVQFRCGYVDDRHEYTVDQLRWTDTGSDWDVIAYAKAGAIAKADGRQLNGAYE